MHERCGASRSAFGVRPRAPATAPGQRVRARSFTTAVPTALRRVDRRGRVADRAWLGAVVCRPAVVDRDRCAVRGADVCRTRNPPRWHRAQQGPAVRGRLDRVSTVPDLAAVVDRLAQPESSREHAAARRSGRLCDARALSRSAVDAVLGRCVCARLPALARRAQPDPRLHRPEHGSAVRRARQEPARRARHSARVLRDRRQRTGVARAGDRCRIRAVRLHLHRCRR